MNSTKNHTISSIGFDWRILFLDIKIKKKEEIIKKCQLNLWLTKDQERFRSVTNYYYKSFQGMIHGLIV